MEKTKRVYYCDMDGVLADFNAEPNAVERFKVEKGFFANLKPITENLNAIKELILKGATVKILTTSPHRRADKDKAKWLKANGLKVKVIYGRPNKAKIDYVKKSERKFAILFDDYGKNLTEWSHGGGYRALKIKPSISIKDYLNRGI
jgi:5'(3')-deoxyribonucleotidase